MNIKTTIQVLKYSLPDLTDFPFCVKETSDDGGRVINVFCVYGDANRVQQTISGKYGRTRICIIPQNADQINYMNEANE